MTENTYDEVGTVYPAPSECEEVWLERWIDRVDEGGGGEFWNRIEAASVESVH